MANSELEAARDMTRNGSALRLLRGELLFKRVHGLLASSSPRVNYLSNKASEAAQQQSEVNSNPNPSSNSSLRDKMLSVTPQPSMDLVDFRQPRNALGNCPFYDYLGVHANMSLNA